MSDVTRILDALADGDPHAAHELLPLVYAELRRLAGAQMAREAPGQTLDATALVHEAYLRLVPTADAQADFAGRGHFFAAAAEAMRRILVDRARARATHKRGGGLRRVELDDVPAADRHPDLLALDEALADLERHDASSARLVKLRYFAGLSHREAAAALGVTPRAADRLWALARAWLLHRLGDN
jgi:RNA polymerase sigma factor (TIGR02999 family)